MAPSTSTQTAQAQRWLRTRRDEYHLAMNLVVCPECSTPLTAIARPRRPNQRLLIDRQTRGNRCIQTAEGKRA